MLDRRAYLVREHVGALKLHEAFDVLDPATGDLLAQATERASPMRKMLKLVLDKRMLPFHVELCDPSGDVLLQMHRGLTLFRSKVVVQDAAGHTIGNFRQRLLSVGGRFTITNAEDRVVAELKGNIIGWDFRFMDTGGRELGRVTRKWGGLAKELLTTADSYVVSIEDGADVAALGPLLLAASICIDLVLKE